MNKNSWWICALIASIMILTFYVQDNSDRIESIEKVFSPPESGPATSQAVGPVHKTFSSPSSVVVGVVPSATIYRVSAYCPGPCCCGKWADGITASGKPAVGLIVAAPSEIPFGTALIIPGYGVAAVQDRGGVITGDRLDVLFPTHQEALEWGVQELKVRVFDGE